MAQPPPFGYAPPPSQSMPPPSQSMPPPSQSMPPPPQQQQAMAYGYGGALPPTAGAPGMAPVVQQPPATSKLEISVECRQLKNMDLMSKSDPFVRLYIAKNGRWEFQGQTEIIKDNLNPKFTTPILIEYFFEEVTILQFRVFDIDNEKDLREEKQDFIGEMVCDLGELAASNGRIMERPLKEHHMEKPPSLLELRRQQSMAVIKPNAAPEKSKRGYIRLTVEELANGSEDDLILEMSATKLKKMDLFGKSDPTLMFYRRPVESAGWVKVYQSEVIKHTLNPVWKPFKIKLGRLCNGDLHRPIRIECSDWNKSGNFETIGYIDTCVNDLMTGPLKVELINPKGKKKSVGTLEVKGARIQRNFTFLQYLQGNCDINFVTAIDFTQSNGDPSHPQSLHFRRPVDFSRLQDGVTPQELGLNDYQSAIISVGRVLAQYDSDQMIPAYGFGGRFSNGAVSHCFNLNGTQNPDCNGVLGVLEAYNNALANVALYGPTIFSEVIRTTATAAYEAFRKRSLAYFVLLIITDGIVTDMQNTVNEIVRASGLPLSIVIVGVGNADFAAMEILDADETPLVSSDGKQMQRDISRTAHMLMASVQFVPFNSVRYAGIGALAKEVLQEIPEQLTSYMRSVGLAPQ